MRDHFVELTEPATTKCYLPADPHCHHRHPTRERGHGREETRSYFVSAVPRDFSARRRWPGLAAIGMVIHETQRDGKWTIEAEVFHPRQKAHGATVREGRLHWQLDVTFRADPCRLRRGNADANFSILRRTALSLLKNNHALKIGVKNKRLAAGWDDEYLAQILFGQ